MLGMTGMAQLATGLGLFSTSTRHMRQLPAIDKPLKKARQTRPHALRHLAPPQRRHSPRPSGHGEARSSFFFPPLARHLRSWKQKRGISTPASAHALSIVVPGFTDTFRSLTNTSTSGLAGGPLAKPRLSTRWLKAEPLIAESRKRVSSRSLLSLWARHVKRTRFATAGAMRLGRALFSKGSPLAGSAAAAPGAVGRAGQTAPPAAGPPPGSLRLEMMELHKGGPGERVVLEGYYSDGFQVFGKRCGGPIAVLPDLATQWRGVAAPSDITYESLTLFILAKPKLDILIIGTGKRTEMVSPALRAQMRAHGIVLECMASDKALATFNILAEESRNVGAALLTMNHSTFQD
jgi:uncharacterized protein